MEYKNETVRYFNGYKVTSRTVKLSKEEEEERYSNIRAELSKIAASRREKVASN